MIEKNGISVEQLCRLHSDRLVATTKLAAKELATTELAAQQPTAGFLRFLHLHTNFFRYNFLKSTNFSANRLS